MFIVVPIACFVALFVAILMLKPHLSLRRAFLSASVMWGVILTCITEVLSLFHALTFGWVLGSWCAVLAAILVATRALASRMISSGDGASLSQLKLRMGKVLIYRPHLSSLPLPLRIAFIGALAIVVITAAIGVIAPPNNWDSMTYHLGRILYWIEHGSVAPYPTDIMRQLYEAPWAEFCVTHLYLLSGGDRFSALVQWWSMVGSLIGVSLIAQQLGANRQGQLFAVVFAGTIPMGILQASSTQTDYTVAFWLVCFAHFLLAFRERPDDIWNSVGIGMSLGLAMLTKATTYVYALPFLVLLAFWAARRMRWRTWEVAAVSGSIAVILNIGYYLRNILAFHALFGPPDEVKTYSNAHFTLSTLISNTIRDLVLQIGTPSARVNAKIDHGVRLLFSVLHLDINDKATTWPPFQVNALSFHEDYAGNPLHFLIIVAVIALCLASIRLRSNHLLLTYIATLIAAFLVFALYLKWQPWHSRLELPLFVLFAPACGVAISKLTPRLGLNLVALILVFASVPWVVANRSRPIVGPYSILTTPRTDQYFANRRTVEPAYVGAVDYLQQKQCYTVGLVDGIDDWEYPLWALLQTPNRSVEMEHVGVQNDTRSLAAMEPYVSFQPCALVSVHKPMVDTLSYHGARYTVGWSSGIVAVYIKR